MMTVNRWIPRLLAAVLLFAASSVLASAALAKPRIMIITDQSYREAVNEVAKVLKDQAEVVIVKTANDEPLGSQAAIDNLDKWLGDAKWDLIYFNVGQVDLTYRAPNMKSFRIMSPAAGGQITTSPQDYEKNLIAIARRLLATRAKLVWASTLPITGSGLSIQVPGSEIEYNKIAASVMNRGRIPISDMHTQVQSLASLPIKGKRMSALEKQPLHLPMIAAIYKMLGLKAP